MKVISYILSGFLLLSAVMHAVSPEIYAPMIPDFLPATPANILAIISEVVVGILLILPKYRKLGGLAFMLLMLIFMPVHIIDALKEQPAIGSKTVAFVRIAIQVVLIYLGWRIYKLNKH